MNTATAATQFEFHGISVNPTIGAVHVDGDAVELTHMEFDLLLLFVTHPGETLHRDRILKNLRGIDAAIVTRSVDVLVGRLRRKLSDSGRNPRFIRTVWGSGYAFIANPN